MKRELTPAQLGAIKRFAKEHGRYWKSKLSTCWMRASYPFYANQNGDAALLQQVRNNLGPSWLHVFDIEAV